MQQINLYKITAKPFQHYQGFKTTMCLGGVLLPLEEQVCSLGVLLDSQLSLNASMAGSGVLCPTLAGLSTEILSQSELVVVVHP